MRRDEALIECACGRRYMRTTIARDESEIGFELCRCERKLGQWSGLMRYEFEPETDGD
jgi:hypothetical protein